MNNEELYRSMDGINDEILLKYYKYKSVKRIVKYRKAAVMAASICLLLMAGTVVGLTTNTLKMPRVEKSTQESVIDDFNNTKRFTITAVASENDKTLLESGKTVPLKLGPNYVSYGFGETDNDNELHFTFYLPQLIVKGENIETITYAVNKYDMMVYNYSYDSSGKIDKNNGTAEFGKQYTVAYEDQKDKYFRIIIDGRVTADEKMFHAVFEPDTYQEKLAVIKNILDDVMVNCIVTYKDGTTESADIVLGAEYHTYDELDDVFADNYKTGIYKDGDIVITFELK